MANLTEVKSTFEWQGRTWKAYWNGKTYGTTKYITCTSPTGSEAKVTYNPSAPHPVSVNKSHSVEFGREAVKSIGIEVGL